jgi:hypothetical protein
VTIWMALAQDDPVGQAAGKSGQHPVSPAPDVAGSRNHVRAHARERLDRPAPYRHVDPALAVVDEFSMAVYGRSMFRSPGGGGDRDVPRLVEVTEPAVAGLTGVPGDG